MDSEIRRDAKSQRKVNDALYEDKDESRRTHSATGREINDVEKRLLKGDRGYDRKHEHIPRGSGDSAPYKFTLAEDKEAKRIARSEKKTHPTYSYRRRLAIGYGHINNQRRRRMERR